MKIKILSYNIHKGFSLTNNRFILPEVKKIFREIHPDIIFLQEVQGEHLSHKKKWKEYPEETQFEFLADTLWPHFSYGQNASYPQGHHGNAILSRFPILNTHNQDLTLHRLEKRGLLHAEILVPDKNKRLHLFNSHINLRHFDRIKQVEKCMQFINEKCPDNEFIWGGDFNDWQEKLTFPILQKLNCKEAFFSTQGTHARTFPCFSPILPLDRLYIRGLKISDQKILRDYPWSTLSDHVAIYCEVEI